MLSLPRRLVAELLYRAVRVPLASIHRRMPLGEVADARRRLAVRPGWCSLFTKAFALVAVRQRILRRAYIPLPTPHLYEHPENVAAISMERMTAEGAAVFVARVRCPEGMTLTRLEQKLRRSKELELTQVAAFRRLLGLARLPWPARRFVWWWGTQLSGQLKANHFGTFAVSPVSGEGAVSPHLLTPITAALNYGVIGDDGLADVCLTFDQRVVLPGAAAKAMQQMEDVLLRDICTELQSSLLLPSLPLRGRGAGGEGVIADRET